MIKFIKYNIQKENISSFKILVGKIYNNYQEISLAKSILIWKIIGDVWKTKLKP